MDEHLKHPVANKESNSEAIKPAMLEVVKAYNCIDKEYGTTEQLCQQQCAALLLDEVKQSVQRTCLIGLNDEVDKKDELEHYHDSEKDAERILRCRWGG